MTEPLDDAGGRMMIDAADWTGYDPKLTVRPKRRAIDPRVHR
jgi:hypothetical protein